MTAVDLRPYRPETAGGPSPAGVPHPLGAIADATGTNFSVFSQDAEAVELLLFDPERPDRLTASVPLDPRLNKSFHFWHARVEGVGAGTPYGYRVTGPRSPRPGHRFDPGKVLLDPYARAVWSDAFDRVAACRPGDNLDGSLRGVVVDLDAYDWAGDTPPRRPMNETVVYELHVGGFTRSASSGVTHPGTFAGLTEKIPYLVDLGVTAVELMPVAAFDHREPLRRHPVTGAALTNYWGYDPYALFAPHPAYAVPGQRPDAVVDEFRDMVKALHRAGIEVILDVVFNHTGEGNHLGPALSLKGFANDVYYLGGGDPEWSYIDYSGCGNTLNVNHPITTQLVVDCLTYWAREMHVDGFRFDEASILTRGQDGSPLPYPPAVWRIEMSESLAGVKLIAEAWDAGGLYDVGRFPDRWAQWNGPFRDDVRRFLRGDGGMVGALACRLSGSADIFEPVAEQPTNAVNFITAHDGFTLRDLVSYDYKHNEANGEDNRDGLDENYSWNCGTEGPSEDPGIRRTRMRQMKNAMAVLLLSQGVPMLVAGDERGRTQSGNNNAYCQDNELSWIDWADDAESTELRRFVREMIRMRRENPALHRRHYVDPDGAATRTTFSWHGCELGRPGWADPQARSLAVTLRHHTESAGDQSPADLHLIFNAYWEELSFDLPEAPSGSAWLRVVDTGRPAPYDVVPAGRAPGHTGSVRVGPRSTVVLRLAGKEAGQ
ncbi:glycogen debranching protein GlgX [Actinoplanes oblitus]|uniref:Glycogen debranching protein GlgX n=1 Tax=Actinoplanes oblitus TaxID=3040509 RepID=A0ABY8W4N6_9ACTN|nr:glycogen debranching protein GlgX [Actinoplanes oblitus]WIM92824.1 glycogen debranching protein GlgX [Actinoplanes oblitus]